MMAPDLSGLRILVVDDNPDNQLLITKFLEMAEAQVQVASSGEEALQRVTQGAIDAILMDIQMPEMDGYETTRQLRARGFRRPIIALSAHAMNHEREKILQAGCDDHVAKPVDRKTLIATLVKYCAPKRIAAAGSL